MPQLMGADRSGTYVGPSPFSLLFYQFYLPPKPFSIKIPADKLLEGLHASSLTASSFPVFRLFSRHIKRAILHKLFRSKW